MTLRPIVTLGDPRLRMPGKRIDSFGAWLHELLDDMTETMRDAPGVGIAAQQVGEALQLCVIEVEDVLYEVANPEIVHLSGEQEDYEGCLSVPGFVALRPRANQAVMVGQDRHGKRIKVSGHRPAGTCHPARVRPPPGRAVHRPPAARRAHHPGRGAARRDDEDDEELASPA